MNGWVLLEHVLFKMTFLLSSFVTDWKNNKTFSEFLEFAKNWNPNNIFEKLTEAFSWRLFSQAFIAIDEIVSIF